MLKSRLSQRCAKLENARWSRLDEGSGNLGALLGSRVYLEVHALNIPVGKVCTDQRSAWLWEVRHVCDETVFHATVQPSRIWFGEVMGPTLFAVLLPTFPVRPYMRALKGLVRGRVNLRLMPSASEYTQESCELLRRIARWGGLRKTSWYLITSTLLSTTRFPSPRTFRSSHFLFALNWPSHNILNKRRTVHPIIIPMTCFGSTEYGLRYISGMEWNVIPISATTNETVKTSTQGIRQKVYAYIVRRLR